MLVRFESSETGEILMYADTARALLQAIGKQTTARGTFTQPEMQPAAAALRLAVAQANEPPNDLVDEEEGERKKKQPVVYLRQRAWPLLDMLERTGHSGPDAYVTWEAAADF